ncbi:MAG: radical SAM protein [Polyangiales bacterium]
MMRYPTFARSLLRAQLRQTDLPRLLTYIVTFTCNARCVMCDSWRKPSNDLSLDEIGRIFSQLPQLDAVRLSGGEPFIRKDLPQIVELVRTELQPFVLHITSNGFLTDRIVAFCEERDRSQPLQLLISIDGVGAKHDQVRGIGHAFERAIETVRALAPRQRELRLKLAVNQTIVDPEGIAHYRELRELLAPLGVRNHLIIAYDDSATYNLAAERCIGPRYPGELRTFGSFTAAELQALLDEAERDLVRYAWPERIAKRYYLDGARQRLLAREPSPNPICIALSSHMRMLPDGSVPTCQFNTVPAGNLRETPFAELWAGEQAKRQRAWVKACPGCWAECEVLPNAIYSGDLARHAATSLVRAARATQKRLLPIR